MSDTLQAEMTARAKLCWELMHDNERAMVRIGMSPLWVVQENLGGKRPASENWPDISQDAEAGRLLQLALFECTKAIGGMIA